MFLRKGVLYVVRRGRVHPTITATAAAAGGRGEKIRE